MKEYYFEPGFELEDVLGSFYCFQAESDSVKTTQFVVPNLELILILNFGEPFTAWFGEQFRQKKSIGKIAVAGSMRNRFNYEVLPGSDVVVLNFILDGFYRLFEIDLSGFKRDILLNDRDLSSTTLVNLWNKTKAQTSISDSVEQIKKIIATYQTVRSPENRFASS